MGTVYALHSGDGQYRYVGATANDLPGRLHSHLVGVSRREDKFSVWKHSVRDTLVIVELETCENEQLNELERQWIIELREAGFDLLNGQDGGYQLSRVGIVHSPEHRAKLAEASRRARALQAPRTAEGNRKASDSLKTSAKAIAQREAMWDAARGRPLPEEHKANVKAARLQWMKDHPEEAYTNNAKGGKVGGHMRWHVKRGIVKPDCTLCQERHVENEGKLPPE